MTEQCMMGHAVCQRCGECHYCWGLGEANCETLAVFVAQQEVGGETIAGAIREKALETMASKGIAVATDGAAKQKEVNDVSRHKHDDKPGAMDIFLQSEVEWDNTVKSFVTKVGAYAVEWDSKITGYRLRTTKLIDVGDNGWHGGTYKSCKHDGAKEVVNVDGVSFRCAKGWDLNPGPVDLIIDLANTQSLGYAFVTGAKPYAELNEFVKTNPVVKLDWKDQCAPPVSLRFWQEFWQRLPKPGKVVICCMGGHGRTGTCLAAFLIASGAMTDIRKVVKLIRTQHCSDAIETNSQMRYLEALCAAVELQMAEEEAALTDTTSVTKQ